MDEALALWRGLPFAGVPGPFAEAERQRLAELRTTAAEERADLLLALGQGRRGGARADRAGGRAPAARAGARAADDRAVPVRQAGRGAAGVPTTPGSGWPRTSASTPATELTRIHEQLLAMDPRARRAAAEAGLVPAQPLTAARLTLLRSAAAARRRCRPRLAGFAGRAAELRLAARDCCPRPRASPVSSSITGTAGVGKTTLAIRFARQAASRFPDGQLYVNLRGFDPSARADAARHGAARRSSTRSGCRRGTCRPPLTRRAGCCAACSTAGACCCCSTTRATPIRSGRSCRAARAAWWWSRAGHQLTGLVVAEGARLLPLGVLDGAEATELLAGRLGAERVAAEPDAVAELVGHCAGLPLALSVTCARAASRGPAWRSSTWPPSWPTRAAGWTRCETGDAVDRPAGRVLLVGRQAQPVRRPGCSGCSALHHGPGHLRRRGGQPGRGCAAGEARARARRADQGLAADRGRGGRFGCHDLLRAYAAERRRPTASGGGARGGAAPDRSTTTCGPRTRRVARLYPARGHVELPPGAAETGSPAGESSAR